MVVAVVAAMAAGCGGASQGPAAAVDAYRVALEKRNYEQAYELMSAEFRGRVSRDEFVRTMRENAAEATDTAARLKATHQSVDVTAEFRYGLADSLRLVLEDGQWRVASNPIEFYSQASPREALRSFVRAYRLKRWDVILRFVPTAYREQMTAEQVEAQFEGDKAEEIDVTIGMLEANIDEPITEKGGEARMPYGERFEVQFAREDGLWKIKDLD